MSPLSDRGENWKTKMAQDSEFRFKVAARRNKLLGRWAASKLGLADDAVDDYVTEVVKSDFEEAGDDDVIRKLKSDFDAKGIAVSPDAIRAKITELQKAAAEQLMSEG